MNVFKMRPLSVLRFEIPACSGWLDCDRVAMVRWGALVLCVTICLYANCGAVVGQSVTANLKVFPREIYLHGARSAQTVVAQAINADGITLGVTENLKLEIADPRIAEIRSQKIVPLVDGKTELVVHWGDIQRTIPVTVKNSRSDPPISFQADVMPVFSKTGCNAGSCHGAARGKDGFRLSLFGYDAKGDYFRLTREMPGRRVDVGMPSECLLISKATNAVAHSGGKLFDTDSSHYATLRRWLTEGANFDADEVPACTSIELLPSRGLFGGAGSGQQMTVTARYADGTRRDVTHLTHFSTSNPDVAAVSQSGRVTAGCHGEALVMARFDTHTVGAGFITLSGDQEFQNSADRYPENNLIDVHINAKLKRLRIYPSPLCGDAEFIRRVMIDLCGRVPTVEERQAFVADVSTEKRGNLIDRLIQRDEFLDIWVMKWAELLKIRTSKTVDAKAALLYFRWLKNKFYQQTPLNKIVVELLSASGGTFENPPANFYEVERNRLKTAENVAQAFLGMRIQCAQCHNHPFDRWTMDDYYSFVAFFAKIRSKPAADPREKIVSVGGGEIKHPVTNKVMQPKFLGGETPKTKGLDRRQVLADWISDPSNPYFARNVANMVWAHFLGRGIIDEVDDVRISNPPVNAALLDALADRFVEGNYDIKKLAKLICNSRTYQLSTEANESNQADLTNFSHAFLRRMRAEVLLDVLAQVTQTKNKFQGMPLGSRATQIADGNTTNYFLKTFGRSSRTSVCSCEVKQEPNLSQALHLLNGDTVSEKIKKGNLVGKWINAGDSDLQIVRRLYLRTISREPSDDELRSIVATIQSVVRGDRDLEQRDSRQREPKPSQGNPKKQNVDLKKGNNTKAKTNPIPHAHKGADAKSARQVKARQRVLEDVFWALLNSREFLFNH